MTLEAQYTRLLEGGRKADTLLFLRALSADERRSLAPLLKKLSKEYLTYQQHGTTWRYKADERQRIVLNYAFFVCYNQKEFEKASAAWLINREFLENFLPWYVPAWFSNYINAAAGRDWLPYQLDYDYLVELTEREIIEPLPQLIARLLVPQLFVQKDRRSDYAFDRLKQHAVTLRQHIWHLFEYETNIQWANRYLYNDGEQVKEDWVTAFQRLIDEGRLDKQRVLSEALLGSNRNFNKNLSGWFAELFTQLSPTAEETINLQTELFTSFSSPHSKVVNTSLQAVKTILLHPRFRTDAFLDYAPPLLASATKTVVASALQLLDKLAKAHPAKSSPICTLASGALVHKDEGLQIRAAKLIQKFGDAEEEALKQTVSAYGGTLFSAAKALLKDFVSETATIPEVPSATVINRSLSDDRALPKYDTVDDLIFLAAQAFDNNESWHLDLLPAAMIGLQNQVRGEDVAKLEPAMQRALKLYFGDWRSAQGTLDHLLASLFLDWCLLLIQRHPAETASARDLFKTFLYKSEENKKLWDEHGPAISFLHNWQASGDRRMYTPHKKLFDAVLSGLRQQSDLPLLCAPTHAPAWIDPVVLVERLWLHQRQNAVPDNTDLGIALSRCRLHHTEEAVQRTREKLTGELKEIMLFLLHAGAPPTGPFTMEAAWMTAALSKSPLTAYPQLHALPYSRKRREVYTGQYPWQTMEETYTYEKYHWADGRYKIVKATGQRKVIQLDLSAQVAAASTAKESGVKKTSETGLWEAQKRNFPSRSLCCTIICAVRSAGFLWKTGTFAASTCWRRTTPNRYWRLPLPSVCSTLHSSAKRTSALWWPYCRRCTTHRRRWPKPATCSLPPAWCAATKPPPPMRPKSGCGPWKKGAWTVQTLGRILGRHERIELAPLKRFTDLVAGSLLGVSARHNKALLLLITALLKELPDLPVKGLKKLLEIYAELLSLNGTSINDAAVEARLKKWKATSSLSRIIGATV